MIQTLSLKGNMSSIIGHAAAGVSVYLACNRLADRRALAALPVFVFLAICPDLDYLAIWLFHSHTAPRLTHTLVFSLVAASVAWLFTASLRKNQRAKLPFIALLTASVSHPLLDLLVGAHPLPLLWPLPDPDVFLPFGVLPSAGSLALENYYLWRNLLIELAVLSPVFAMLVVFARRIPFRTIAPKAFVVAPLWLLFVVWSVGLQR
ncbi:MAG: metal-dependent hydrolase [Bradyrhizobium sp.]